MQTILCVDDHQPTLFTLSHIFRGAGYSCITASDFEEADRTFSTAKIDLVILDHCLPGINGTAVAAHLKSIRPVAVIMLSGNSELTGAPDSVDLLLPKPLAPETLLEAVAGVIKAFPLKSTGREQ